MWQRALSVVASGLITAALAACEATSPAANSGETPTPQPEPTLSIEALQDPETCRPCHTQHYLEWESSMHAYAAKDPVFTAMNERGQRETDGALGELCVKCHAPMALELGLTRDGLNLPDLDDPNTRGVTCYFCHDIDQITADHNRGVSLAHDAVMRGGLGPHDSATDAENIAAPAKNAAHASEYSALHDNASTRSAELCGGCHDIRTDSGVALERTFTEWRESHFSDEANLRTCASCHMPSYTGHAAPDAPARKLHRHMWPGVDTALTNSYPGSAAQALAIECTFQDAIRLEMSAEDPAYVSVTVWNRGAGHAWPSGSAQDRRAWVELIAYDANDQVIYQSGVIEDGAVVGANEPGLEVLRDQLLDADGKPVHMFWEAAPSSEHPLGYETSLLGVPSAPSSTRRFEYALPSPAARVTALLRLQAIGLDVIDDFQGMSLPITERVIADVYMQSGNLRSRIRTIAVNGTRHELALSEDGRLLPNDELVQALDCGDQSYASKL